MLRVGMSGFLGTALIALLLPVSAAQTRRPAEDGPLENLVRIAFAGGFGGPLSGKICTALGVTANNEPLPVEQISARAEGNTRTFNVSRHRGWLDVIIAVKVKDQTTVFLTSAKGDLEKAVLDKQGQPVREIPAADVMPAFEAEKSWWLDVWLKTQSAGPARK
jgi:hypothetical protein